MQRRAGLEFNNAKILGLGRLTEIENLDAISVANRLMNSGGFPSKSKWLITGASGFLGSQILNTLNEMRNLGLDLEILSIDSAMRGQNRNWYFKGSTVMNFDVTKPWPRLEPYSHILHLASIASPVYYRKYPLETLDSNYSGTLAALEHAKKWKSKILLMSSSEIYGDPMAHAIPTSEEYRGNVSSIGPRACYDEGKRVMETLGWIYAEHFGVDVAIARPFNFYGPGMRLDDGRVLPDFFNAIQERLDLTIHSDGTPKRSFCYVSDAIEALLKFVLAIDGFEVLNIGNPTEEISVSDLATIVAAQSVKFGWNGKVQLRNSPEENYLVNNPLRRVPDISRIQNYLDWTPRTSLQDGINKSLRHFNEFKSL